MNFDHLKKRHMNFKFENSNSHIRVFQFCTSIYFDRGYIPWSKFRKPRFQYLPQLGNFKFVDCWILTFVRMMRFLFPHFIIKLAPTCKWPIKTKIDDSDLKYPQHQGWYENLKFIGMHPEAIKIWLNRLVVGSSGSPYNIPLVALHTLWVIPFRLCCVLRRCFLNFDEESPVSIHQGPNSFCASWHAQMSLPFNEQM